MFSPISVYTSTWVESEVLVLPFIYRYLQFGELSSSIKQIIIIILIKINHTVGITFLAQASCFLATPEYEDM